MMARVRQQASTVGQFRLGDFAGEDEFREQYTAYEIDTGRPARLYILKPEYAADADFLQQYLLRTQSLTQIRQPNLLLYLEAGLTGDSQPFVACESFEAYPLASRLERLVQEEAPAQSIYALTLLKQVATGLELLERLGIFHHELTPQHILLRSVTVRNDESVIVTDLDLPPDFEPESSPLVEEARPYLSPEQLGGKMIDGRSHVYSAGVILHEMLCGKRPERPQTRWSRAIAGLKGGSDLNRIRPDLASETITVVEKSLSKAPRRRYGSVGEFRVALEKALAAENLQLHNSGEETVAQPRRTYLLPLIMLLLCIVAGFSLLRFLPSVRSASFASALAAAQTEVLPAEEPIGEPAEELSPTLAAASNTPLTPTAQPSSTPVETSSAGIAVTVQPTLLASSTAAPSLLPSPQKTPTATTLPTVTATAEPTSTPETHFRVVVSSANLRAGPGTVYDSLGFVLEGEQLNIIARSTGTYSWLNVETEDGRQAWIAYDVGELQGPLELSSIEEVATIPPAPTATSTPTPTSTPIPPTVEPLPSGGGGGNGSSGGSDGGQPRATPTPPL